MPTEADCREDMASKIEPLFLDSPASRDKLPIDGGPVLQYDD